MAERILIHEPSYDDNRFSIEINNDFSILARVGCARCSKLIYKGTWHAIIKAGIPGHTKGGSYYYCITCVGEVAKIFQSLHNKMLLEDVLK